MAILLGWELFVYLDGADASQSDWLMPIAAALVIQMALISWRLWHRGKAGVLTALTIVGPTIGLALIFERSPRPDVIFFIGSLIGFATGQVIMPSISIHGDTAET